MAADPIRDMVRAATGASLNGKPLDEAAVEAHYAKMAQEWGGEVVVPNGRPVVSDDDSWPFMCLGHDKGIYFFLGQDARQVMGWESSQLTKNRLMTLCPMKFYERMWGNRDGIQWDLAVNAIINKSHTMGIYDPNRVRGRGAWYDKNGPVLHLGDGVINAAGIHTPIKQVRHGKYIYQQAVALDVQHDNPLTVEEATELIPILELISWEQPVSAQLLAGWAVIAPICGALQWRSHVWLTGGRGTGKSHIVNEIIRKLIGNLCLSVQSATTEAGIRQSLNHDAFAVVFDEAESSDERSGNRIQMVLELMRQACSLGGAAIIKGSATGGAKTFQIQSSFLMSSIGVGAKKAADTSRVSVLSIIKRRDGGEFAQMQKLTASTLTEEFCRRFVARSISLITVIRANALTFAKAGAKALGSQRAGDQIGTLLAGAYTLVSDEVISLEDAEKWIGNQDWSEQKQVEENEDEASCLQHLLAHVVEVQGTSYRGKRSVGEIIAVAANEVLDAFSSADAQATLMRMGLMVHPSSEALGSGQLVISNTHPAVGELLRGTGWGTAWARIFGRIPGSVSTDGPIRFGASYRSRGVGIPLENL